MKVLFIASWFPSRVHPTHGNFVAKHARLVAKAEDLTVLSIQDDPSLPMGQRETIERREDGYTLIQVLFGQPPGTSSFCKVWSRWGAYESGMQRIRKAIGLPDILHAHVLLDAGIIAGYWAKQWNLPYLITEHSTAYHQRGALPGLRGVLGRWAARHAAFILPVSRQLGQSMRNKNLLKGNYRQVSNVVNTDVFHYVPPPPQEPFVFLHVSNFDDGHKNISGLLAAFQVVCSRTDRPVQLSIAGDGALATLLTKIKAYNFCAGQIVVSGPHTELEIAALLQQCHAFVLPSHVENEPVVLLEAQAAGRPCIASRVGGIPEIINDANVGILIEVRNNGQLVEAMLTLMREYDDYDLPRIRQSALGRYGEAAVLTALQSCYQAAVG
ncbi:MAG: glycosyltransferase [Bacteroidota bacterium]